MNIREIPARVVAEVCETTPDYLRNYRADGLLEGVGEKVGVGFVYSRPECLSINLAGQLSKAGLGLKTAFDVVFTNPTPEIVAAIAGHGGMATFRPRRGSNAGGLAVSVKIVVDLGVLVRDGAARLDVALERDRRKAGLGRRLSFGPSSSMVSSSRA